MKTRLQKYNYLVGYTRKVGEVEAKAHYKSYYIDESNHVWRWNRFDEVFTRMENGLVIKMKRSEVIVTRSVKDGPSPEDFKFCDTSKNWII